MKRTFQLIVLVVAILAVSGCADDEGSPGDPDGTCYDCTSVCDGTLGEVQNECYAQCGNECMGSSDCFAWMEGRYEGQEIPMAEWQSVECTDAITGATTGEE